MSKENWAAMADEITNRLGELGLTLEQVGPEYAVDVEMEEATGAIVLTMGDEERLCTELDDALDALEEWAADVGADPDRPGAIVEFTDRVAELLEQVPAEERLSAFFDLELSALLDGCGLSELEPDAFTAAEDADEALCVVEDGNGAVWVVFLDEESEVSYDEAVADAA